MFYGSFDWHSCVQMHWVLVRLLRVAPDEVPADEIRVALGAHFEPVALAVEEDFIVGPGRTFQRPYGWGWALMLINETATWDDQYGRKWAAAMSPLGDKITGLYLDWLGNATYPIRYGVHENSATGWSARCRTPGRGPGPGTASCSTRSRPRPTNGTGPTWTTRPAGSHPGTTSCRRRWPRPS